MDINRVVSGAYVLNMVNCAAWFASVCFIRGSYSSKLYQLSTSEKVLARAPARVIRWFSYPLPLTGTLADMAWMRLTERHLQNVRGASKANDALFVAPWVMALLSALCGVGQLIFVSVESSLQRLPLSETLLCWGISFLCLIPLLATHEFRDSRWRARAPFEWQYLAAAIWLLHSTQKTQHNRSEGANRLSLYSLTRVEEVLLNRFHPLPPAAAPSAELAQRTWRGKIGPLLDEAALLHLRPAGDTAQTLVDNWVSKSASIIADGGTPNRKGLNYFRAKAEGTSPHGQVVLENKTRSSTRAVIFWLGLAGTGSIALGWVADYFANPQPLHDLARQAQNFPPGALAVLTTTFGLLGSALTAIVSLTPLLRKGRQG